MLATCYLVVTSKADGLAAYGPRVENMRVGMSKIKNICADLTNLQNLGTMLMTGTKALI
jgi:hypothetical protein